MTRCVCAICIGFLLASICLLHPPRHASADAFAPPPLKSRSLSLEPGALVAAEFNGDGVPDAAVAHPADGRVSILFSGPDGPISEIRSWPVGNSPIFLVAADMDDDGATDLVVVNSGSASVSVLANDGTGTFTLSEVLVDPNPRAAMVIDFDADGSLDLLVVSATSTDLGTLALYRRSPNGHFESTERFAVGDNPHSLALGDFEGRGIVDVAVSHTTSVTVFSGDGLGGLLASKSQAVVGNPRFLVGVDFQDGRASDLAFISSSGTLEYLKNLGDRRFEQRTIGRPGVRGGITGAFLYRDDVDGDSASDLLTQAVRSGRHSLQVLRGHDNGTFDIYQEISLGDLSPDMVLSDLDDDGNREVLVSRIAPREILVLAASDNGRLRVPPSLPLGGLPLELAVGDLDGDGSSEIVVAGSGFLAVSRATSWQQFAPFVATEDPGVGFVIDLELMDFDDRPGVEVIAADLLGSSITVRRVDPTGDWEIVRQFGVDAVVSDVTIADYDSDGALDFAIGDSSGNSIVLVLSGSDDPVRFPIGSPQSALLATDIDRDGHSDLVASLRDNAVILFGNGGGGFHRTRDLPDGGSASRIAVGEINVAGNSDLIFVLKSRGLRWVRGVSGVEVASTLLAAEHRIRDVELVDVDDDGFVDIVAASAQPFYGILVFRGNATGFAETPERYLAGGDAVAVADLDGDGRPDAVGADAISSRIDFLWAAISEGETSRFRRGDVDGDGRVTLSDAVRILETLFAGARELPCSDATDADDDGRVNLTDAIVVLQYLFLGGWTPPDPGPESCGSDPSMDALPLCGGICTP